MKFQKPTDEFFNFRQLENAIFGNSILNGKSAHPHPSEVNDFFVNLEVASVGDWVAAGTLPCPRPAKQNIYGTMIAGPACVALLCGRDGVVWVLSSIDLAG